VHAEARWVGQEELYTQLARHFGELDMMFAELERHAELQQGACLRQEL
jgi:hypothetical protein